MNIYLAASLSHDRRQSMYDALRILRNKGFKVYAPVEHFVEDAWDLPNDKWGLQVFHSDIEAIKNCDLVVSLSWGRLQTTSETTWEQGFAFGIGKKIILVEMTNHIQSVMVANGRYATVKGLEGLEKYDFNKLPETRTNTEQK